MVEPEMVPPAAGEFSHLDLLNDAIARFARYGASVTVPALDQALGALSRGDVLIAFDLATAALHEEPDSLEARFVGALALARAGATDAAERMTTDLLALLADATDVPVALREDVEALAARLMKDRAFATTGSARSQRLREAAARYETVARKYVGYFSSVNAATLYLLAGDVEQARALARWSLELAKQAPDGPDAYWRDATEAEAALVLGDVEFATSALERAASGAPDHYAERAVTRRQLRMVCTATGCDMGVLDVLSCPSVLHYCGHRVDDSAGARFPSSAEPGVAQQVREFVGAQQVGYAYGSAASGADVVIVEALLERGAEVHLVLPFSVVEFEKLSVEPAGGVWVARYRSCLARASSVRVVSDSVFLAEGEVFGYAARIAMGHAITRARFLDTRVEQLAVWDGRQTTEPAGTAHDVAVWRAAGRRTHVIQVGATISQPTGGPAPRLGRAVRAILFADFHGFSRLLDEQFEPFVERVLAALGEVLDAHGAAIVYRNSWGDGIQAVFADVTSAAECALGLQEALTSVDLSTIGLPSDLRLRIGVHAGPVLTMDDPIRSRIGVWGREVTRAARVEPRTPEGEVYVTEAFAALLALEGRSAFVTDYIGRVTTAKDFETIPMFRLRRSQPNETDSVLDGVANDR